MRQIVSEATNGALHLDPHALANGRSSRLYWTGHGHRSRWKGDISIESECYQKFTFHSPRTDGSTYASKASGELTRAGAHGVDATCRRQPGMYEHLSSTMKCHPSFVHCVVTI